LQCSAVELQLVADLEYVEHRTSTLKWLYAVKMKIFRTDNTTVEEKARNNADIKD